LRSRKRLLFLNHNIAWSGTFFRAFHLGRHLAKLGHDVTLVTTHPSDRGRMSTAERDGLKIVFAPDLLWGPARQGFDPYNTLRRIGRLAGSSWDLIHAFDSRPVVSIPAWWLTRDGQTPLVMDWADWWGRGGTIEERSGWLVRTFFGPIETWFEEAFRNKTAGTTVISTALARRAEQLGVPRETILRLPHGCDLEGFPVRDRAQCRLELGLTDTPLLLHLGNLFRRDADLLFGGLRVVLDRHSQARVVLAGRVRVEVPSDLERRGAVLRTGSVSYPVLQTWLGAADFCVLPLTDSIANRGRWPSKVNDYFAAGRAVVMTDVSDAALFVRDAQAGWTTAASVSGLGAAMAAAVADGPALASAGAHARRLAESELAWPNLAAGVDAFYSRLADVREVRILEN